MYMIWYRNEIPFTNLMIRVLPCVRTLDRAPAGVGLARDRLGDRVSFALWRYGDGTGGESAGKPRPMKEEWWWISNGSVKRLKYTSSLSNGVAPTSGKPGGCCRGGLGMRCRGWRKCNPCLLIGSFQDDAANVIQIDLLSLTLFDHLPFSICTTLYHK